MLYTKNSNPTTVILTWKRLVISHKLESHTQVQVVH